MLENLMYKRLYKFLNYKDILNELQFGFRQNFSAPYALICVTENIRHILDEGKIDCGIFVDLTSKGIRYNGT